jgi:hypothetical protein
MRGRVDLDVRPEEHIAANADLRGVQNDATEIRIEVVAEPDVVAVIAEEGRLDLNPWPGFSEEFPQENEPLFRLVRG